MKRKTIDYETSERFGLWHSKEWHRWHSQVLDIKDLDKYKGKIRIVMTRNKYRSGKENRPTHVFWITGANNIEPKQQVILKYEEDEELELEDSERAVKEKDGHFRTLDGTRLFTLEEVQWCINKSALDGQAGYTDNIPEDYIDIR